ncbi:MAG: LON peptidase substrate-binding domain-containing protein [Acidimicrobiia bacterium]|nr:LON peptidase substrate-binding domain-containing protein [Acidimicrobiia bacterium]
MAPAPTPMFPLGSVLFPNALLPLHVFEDRYQALVDRCLTDDVPFGVVLIERGSEVGGGDVRFPVGTLARIVQAGRFDDGRYAVVSAGVQRCRVREWLPDDPYPQARVEVLEEHADADAAVLIPEVTLLLRRVVALHGRLGAEVPSEEIVLDEDPILASFEAAAFAPIGSLDAQRLLELDDAGARLAALVDLLTDEAAVLEFRLSDR